MILSHFCPFGAYCVMEEVSERLAPAALPAPLHSSSSASSPCDISRGRPATEAAAEGRGGGVAARQAVPSRAESIKAHQIKNSPTLKVTNIGRGGQSCHGFDIA